MTAKKDKDKKKEKPLPDTYCDWNGSCGKKAFAEVYPLDVKATLEVDYPVFSGEGWSYLCFKHFVYATLRGDSMVWSEVNIDTTTRFQNIIIKILGGIVNIYTNIRKIKYYISLINKINKMRIYSDIVSKINDTNKKM